MTRTIALDLYPQGKSSLATHTRQSTYLEENYFLWMIPKEVEDVDQERVVPKTRNDRMLVMKMLHTPAEHLSSCCMTDRLTPL